MKKSYETPAMDVIKFEYKDQVVASSSGCYSTNEGPVGTDCHKYIPVANTGA